MKLKITKRKADWSNVNHQKNVVIVEFPNCTFKWMPTYEQLIDIRKALEEIEMESWHNDKLHNREKARVQDSESSKEIS